MKIIYFVLALFCFASCKHNATNEKEDLQIKSILKTQLHESYAGSFVLFSFMNANDLNFKCNSTLDYKEKADSLYQVIDTEIKFIDYESEITINNAKNFEVFKNSFILFNSSFDNLWNASCRMNSMSKAVDQFSIARIQQIMYKRKYEELLLYTYILKINFPKWGKSDDFY